MGDRLPYQWYDTPNIHLCTVADFDAFLRERNCVVENRVVLVDGHAVNVLPNLLGELSGRFRRRSGACRTCFRECDGGGFGAIKSPKAYRQYGEGEQRRNAPKAHLLRVAAKKHVHSRLAHILDIRCTSRLASHRFLAVQRIRESKSDRLLSYLREDPRAEAGNAGRQSAEQEEQHDGAHQVAPDRDRPAAAGDGVFSSGMPR